MGISDIEWTYYTFNIVWGCEKVSPACKFCYAEGTSIWRGFKNLWGPGSERRVLSDSYWREPLKWDAEAKKAGERRRVFCSSMADVFEDHPTVNQQRERLWALIEATPNLDWLLLTKRPENFKRFLPWYESGISPANVWLGVTTENQKYLDLRVPLLLLAAARRHFISYEPALGPINAAFYLDCEKCHGDVTANGGCQLCQGMPRLNWVICGGESGQSARPMHPNWARSIRDQVKAACKSFFFKQWGEWMPVFHGINPSDNDPMARIHAGQTFPPEKGDPEQDGKPIGQHMWKVGKKASGRVLDGRTWDQVPEENEN
jgi:protein gp37